jgi:hypothetical protein
VGTVGTAGTSAQVLAAFPTACYLLLPGGEVVAVLTRDAVALPLGLLLPQTSRTLELSSTDTVIVGGGVLTLHGLRAGPLRIRPDGRRQVCAVAAGCPDAIAVREVRAVLSTIDGIDGIDGIDLHGPGALSARAVPALIGSGPGLTPAGDDWLCGYLTGCHLFGVAASAVTAAVRERLHQDVTTALSAALLQAACRAEALPELDALARAVCAERAAVAHRSALYVALAAVLAIGHSSGTALAAGLCRAAEVGAAVGTTRARTVATNAGATGGITGGITGGPHAGRAADTSAGPLPRSEEP